MTGRWRRGTGIVEPGSVPGESRVGYIEYGGIDYTDNWYARYAEGNRHTEHWEQVSVIHGSIEGVDDPRWRVGDEVFFRVSRAIRFLADESAGY